jgi:hypothetical protein
VKRKACLRREANEKLGIWPVKIIAGKIRKITKL